MPDHATHTTPAAQDVDRIKEWAAERRKAHNAAHPENPIAPGAPLHGVAFSGGGIRSATISLGFTRAIAESGQWSRHDLLSTVSGGGYTGAMLGRLASRCQDGTAWRKVVEALGATARERPTWLQWWLRANGRYLIPSGFKDSILAVTTYVRNVSAIHVELGLAGILLGCVMATLVLAGWWLRSMLSSEWGTFTAWLDDGLFGGFVPVPLLLLPLAMAWALAMSLAYWAIASPVKPPQVWRNVLAWFVAGIVLALALPSLIVPAVARWGTDIRSVLFVAAQLLAPFWLCAWWIVVRTERRAVATHTNTKSLLTRRLSGATWLMITLLAVGAIDRAAWALAFEAELLAQAGIALVLAVAVLRAILPKVETLVAGRISTAALTSIASLLGWLLAFCFIAWWVSVVYRTVLGAAFGGEPGWLASWLDGWTPLTPASMRGQLNSAAQAPPVALGRAALVLFAMAAVPGIYSWVSRKNVGFLNASSLHSFYCSRLVRSYLGAVNPGRFRGQCGPLGTANEMPPEPAGGFQIDAITEVHPDDDLPMTAYAPHRVGAPVHLVNVCVNQTNDPRGGLYNRDRLGLALTIGPGQAMRVGLRPWQAGDAASLTLGAWTAISGAAVAPGLGNRTRGGLAVLTMLAGIRLGYWWDGLPGAAQRPARPFAKQFGLLDEMSASFPGTSARQAFMTDGGHSENTGVFTLLTAHCSFIIALDCGADPDFRFSDLENLIRRARIDLDTNIEVLEPKRTAATPLPDWLGLFGTLDDLKSQTSEARLALALIRYANGDTGLMLLVKPTMWSSMPADLANYHHRNPSFPQQTTADQFFDEEQWESYYKLGDELGQAVADALAGQLADDPSLWKAYFTQLPRVKPLQALPAAAPASSAPARLAARFAATPLQASVGVGVSLTAAVGLWQGVDGFLKRMEERQQAEASALKELTELWGSLPGAKAGKAASSPASGAAASTASPAVQATNNLAARLARLSDTLCTSDTSNWFTQSPLATMVLSQTSAACYLLGASAGPGCDWLMRADQGPERSCLFGKKVNNDTCSPRYWAYHYGVDAASQNCKPPDAANDKEEQTDEVKKPVATPASKSMAEPPPNQALEKSTQAAASRKEACTGITIYLQVFGAEWRDTARQWRDLWHQPGVTVPPIEDVLATSLANRRVAPLPVRDPELRVPRDDKDALTCANALVQTLEPRYGKPIVKVIPDRLSPKPKIVEVWLPPRQPAEDRRQVMPEASPSTDQKKP